MEQISTVGARRNEDIALDMMKFIATTTAIGRATTATGFTGSTPTKPEDYAAQLLELYGRCLNAVQNKG